MAFTQAQYDSLQDAYAKGVLEVEYADQRVIYRSLRDMRSLLNQMAAELGIKKPWDGRTKVRFNNGL
jgi:hypothetical protein